VKKKEIAAGVAGLVLLGTAATGLTGWYREHQHVLDMEQEMVELRQQEKRSSVLRSVSKQMEELAYQQRTISDEQREEALQQKKVADEMRQRSEVERQNAIIAQNQAIASEQQAQEARQLAESERQMAEHQRIQAEFSKRVADTLSYIALGRSLSVLSSTQSQIGNAELADLLAYASYHYINKYKSEVYYPTVFKALMSSSQSKRSWLRHQGAVMGMANMPNDDKSILTVSNYGEIILHTKKNGQLESNTLFSSKDFDFRDVYVDKSDVVYAVSREGQLVVINGKTAKVVPLSMMNHPQGISQLDGQHLLLIGEDGLAVYDTQGGMITDSRTFDFRFTATSRYNEKPLVFDNQGRQHLVSGLHEIETTPVPVKGQVTAFASSKHTKKQAYGMSDGTIYVYDEQEGTITKLQGHLSRISKMKLNGNALYSASYDGNVNLWNTASEKVEPMTLLTADFWITTLAFDAAKEHAWIGDAQGNITEALMSVPMMVDIIRGKLKRDFTKDEWNYYIGSKVPFESFQSSRGKEKKP